MITLIVLAAVLGEFALAVGVGKLLAASSAATVPVTVRPAHQEWLDAA